MKKVICLVLATLLLFMTGAIADHAYAQGGSHGGGGGSHGGGGGSHGGGGGSHGGGGHWGGSHGGHWSGGVWIGPGWGWGWGLGGWGPWWWGAPYYPYYPYYPPAVMEQQPQVYVEPAPQEEEQSYWYYCRNPQGYYPYVQQCPGGWLKVIPSAVPPDVKE